MRLGLTSSISKLDEQAHFLRVIATFVGPSRPQLHRRILRDSYMRNYALRGGTFAHGQRANVLWCTNPDIERWPTVSGVGLVLLVGHEPGADVCRPGRPKVLESKFESPELRSVASPTQSVGRYLGAGPSEPILSLNFEAFAISLGSRELILSFEFEPFTISPSLVLSQAPLLSYFGFSISAFDPPGNEVEGTQAEASRRDCKLPVHFSKPTAPPARLSRSRPVRACDRCTTHPLPSLAAHYISLSTCHGPAAHRKIANALLICAARPGNRWGERRSASDGCIGVSCASFALSVIAFAFPKERERDVVDASATRSAHNSTHVTGPRPTRGVGLELAQSAPLSRPSS
jgi:hypothetical protein